MKKFMLLIFILLSINLYSFDCKVIAKDREYNYSDLVLLGKITQINSKFFEVKVLELFKGNVIDKIRFTITNTTVNPTVGDIWLLYSTKNKNNEYQVSVCGNSRSFKFPFSKNSSNFPKPPSKINVDLIDMFSETNFSLALLELNSDITNLRLIRTQNKLNKIQNNLIFLENQILYFKFILASILVLFCVIVFYIKRHKF